MNKKFLSMAAAAMMFAACSDDLKVDQAPEIAKTTTEVNADQVPVSFGAYVNRATTRAGLTDVLVKGDYDAVNTTQTGLGLSGFGVFAYYTNNQIYSDNAWTPNFMYNQRVANSSTTAGTYNWTYTPNKYWPNEYGADATSADVDRVSFFAYAPYVSVDISSGAANGNGSVYAEDTGASTGITGVSRNTRSGDPYVKFVVSPNLGAGLVDLCYATPVKDKVNPAGISPIELTFNHALAALNVQIDTKVTSTGHAAGDDALDVTNTRVYVRKIEFNGIATKGALNLNGGNWMDYNAIDALSSGTLTINDGRRDGYEAVYDRGEGNSNLNADIIQKNGATTQPGVTNTAVNLFEPATQFADPAVPTPAEVAQRLAEPIYVIPTVDNLSVTITYDVETVDANLATTLSGSTTTGSSVQNVITKDVGMALTKGMKYILKLHLGLNTVEFDVQAVNGWPDEATSIKPDVELPGYIVGTMAEAKIALDAIKTAHDADPSYDTDAALAEQKALYLYKYVDGEGNIMGSYNASAIGMIAQMEWDEGKIDGNINLADAKILVLAAANAPSQSGATTMKWWDSATAATLVGTPPARTTNGAGVSEFDAPFPINGYDFTSTYYNTDDDGDGTKDFAALYAAYNYNLTDRAGITVVGYGNNATTGAKGHWFLPSVGQMLNMGLPNNTNLNSDNANWVPLGENAYTKMGIPSGAYWSSSEFNATAAWYFNFNSPSRRFSNPNKTTAFNVRPVFAY